MRTFLHIALFLSLFQLFNAFHRITNTPMLNKCLVKMISEGSVPKPNIITPSYGPKKDAIDKFLMMYTCKICSGRNAQMVCTI